MPTDWEIDKRIADLHDKFREFTEKDIDEDHCCCDCKKKESMAYSDLMNYDEIEKYLDSELKSARCRLSGLQDTYKNIFDHILNVTEECEKLEGALQTIKELKKLQERR